MLPYQDICLKTCDIAREAGAYIARERENFNDSMVEYKGLHDLVSYVDRQTEELIIGKLAALLPESGFIAEEGTEVKRGEKYNWIIDPLDGTTNFIQGIPVYAVSIALMEDGEIVLGVVYEIGRQECFYAWQGGGAYLDGSAISVSQKSETHLSLVATGFPYSNFNMIDPYIAFLKWTMQNSRGVRRLGSAATDLVYVACGRFDLFWEYDLKPWDVAAGTLILKEAGGRVADFKGGNDYLFGKTLIASNEALFDTFLLKLKEYLG